MITSKKIKNTILLEPAENSEGYEKELKRLAHEYIDKRWWVFICRPHGEINKDGKPANKEPHYLVPNGFKGATNDKDQIDVWLEKVPNANLAIACGQSDLVFIDIDPRNGGRFRENDDYFSVFSQNGNEYKLPKTRVVKSGGGGYHLYYSGALNLPGKLDVGIDIKSNGYVIAPPSIHKSGNSYQLWIDYPIVQFPLQLLDKEGKTNADKTVDRNSGFDYQKEVRQGSRHNEIVRLAGHCTCLEIPIKDAIKAAIGYNMSFHPPLPESEIVMTIKDCYERYRENFYNSLFKSAIPEMPPFSVDGLVEPPPPIAYYCDYPIGKRENDGTPTSDLISHEGKYNSWNKRRFTTAELLEAKIPEIKWAIPNLIPEGLTLLGGRPKVGKSWLALQMLHAVSTGGIFFGEKVEQGKCLYYALEDNAKRLQNRARTQGIPPEADITFLRDLKPLQGEGFDELVSEISKETYKLIIVDTYTKAINGLDQNDQPKISEVMNKLQKLSADKNVALVFVDHTSKPKGMANDPINDIMNSTVKVAVADQILGLYKQNGKSGAVLIGRGREIEEVEISLSWDKVNCTWVKAGEAEYDRVTPEDRRILDALAILGRCSCAELADYLGKDKSNTYKTLNKMVELEFIDKDEDVKPAQYFLITKVNTTDTTDTPTTTTTPWSTDTQQNCMD